MPRTKPTSPLSSTSATNESALLADQLRRAFEGDAWHGPALLELLAHIDAPTAAMHPIKDVHSIWELVLHIAAWDDAVNRRIVLGKALELQDEENFPPVKDKSSAEWKKAVDHVKQAHKQLLRTVEALPDHRTSSGQDLQHPFHARGRRPTRALPRRTNCNPEKGAHLKR